VKGDYKLFRQGGGRTAFAHVYVELITWEGEGDQVVTVLDHTTQLTTLIEQDLQWIEAALEGCWNSLQALQIEGIQIKGYQVQVTRLLTNLVDTTSDTIKAAAFLATATAFDVQNQFQLIFENGWKVLPTRNSYPS